VIEMMVPVNWDNVLGKTAKSVTEVADYLGLSVPTASNILSGAVRTGVVEQRTDPESGVFYYSVKEK